jgi:hypothetical protein
LGLSRLSAWWVALGIDLATSSFIRANTRLDKVQKVAGICPNKTAKEPNEE